MKIAGQSIESIVHPDDWRNVRNKIEYMVKAGNEEIDTAANSGERRIVFMLLSSCDHIVIKLWSRCIHTMVRLWSC